MLVSRREDDQCDAESYIRREMRCLVCVLQVPCINQESVLNGADFGYADNGHLAVSLNRFAISVSALQLEEGGRNEREVVCNCADSTHWHAAD